MDLEKFECPVCFKSLNVKQIIKLPCKHIYCRTCSKKIDKCALCRASFKDDVFDVYTKKIEAYRREQDGMNSDLTREKVKRSDAIKNKIYRDKMAFVKVLDRFDDDDVDNCTKWAKLYKQFNEIYDIQKRQCVEYHKSFKRILR